MVCFKDKSNSKNISNPSLHKILNQKEKYYFSFLDK